MENQYKSTSVVSNDNTPIIPGTGAVYPDVISPSNASSVTSASYDAPIIPEASSLETPQVVAPSVLSSPPAVANESVFSPLIHPKRPSINKAFIIIGLVAMLIVIGVASIAGYISRKNTAQLQPASQSVNEQGITLGSATPDVLSVLQLKGSQNKLIVNGDIITTGRLSLASGNYYGQFMTNELTANREYALPDASGTICLDSNNCNYVTGANTVGSINGESGAFTLGTGLGLQGTTIVTTAKGTTIAGQAADFTLGAGLSISGTTIFNSLIQTTLNNISGDVILQGTTGQISVNENGSIITLSTPQDIASTSTPAFAGVTLTAVGTQNGNVLCDISNNCGYSGGAGSSFLQGGNSFGTTATLGTNDNNSLVLETNNQARVTIDTAGNVGIGAASTGSRLHVAWNSGDTAATASFGSTNAANNQTAIVANSYSGAGISSTSQTDWGVFGQSNGNGSGGASGFNSGGVLGSAVGATNSYGVLGIGTIFGGGNNIGVGALGSSYGLFAQSTESSAIFAKGGCNGFFGCTPSVAPIEVLQQYNNVTTNDFLQAQNASGQVFFKIAYDGRITTGLAGGSNGQVIFNSLSNTNTITLDAAIPSGNRVITLPNASGTICLTSGNCVGMGGYGDILNNGNTNGGSITIGTNDAFGLNFETQNIVQVNIAAGGATLFKNSTDSTAAFNIQNASATNVLTVDTTNSQTILRGKNSSPVPTGPELLTSQNFTNSTYWDCSAWTTTTTTAANSGGATPCRATTTNFTPTVGTTYAVTFTLTGLSSGSVQVYIGGQIAGGGSTNGTHTLYALAASSSFSVDFYPINGFQGTVSAVSVRQVTVSNPVLLVQNSSGVTTLEVRASSSPSNVLIGLSAGSYNASGTDLTAVGSYALQNNISGIENTAIGAYSLQNNTTGSRNTANGSYALQNNTSGSFNTAIGNVALENNTTGSSNVAVGMLSLNSNINGSENVGVGMYSLFSNTSGSDNVALGYEALYNNDDGDFNIALGYDSLAGNTSGSYNIALGQFAADNVDAGNDNTSIGRGSLCFIQNGSNNVSIGKYSGCADTDNFGGSDVSNSVAIGSNTVLQQSNTVILGGAGSNAVNVGIGTTKPGNTFSVSPVQYSTGTASQSGTTITGTGTTFTTGMVGNVIIFANGSSATITGFTDTTHLTVNVSQTVSSQNYRIHYTGLQVASSGNVGINNLAPANRLAINTAITSDSLAQGLLSTGATTSKGLVVQGVASQAANLQEWQDSTGASLASINQNGSLSIGSAAADAGAIRLNNAYSIQFRNGANNGNINAIGLDGSNNLLLNGGNGTTGVLALQNNGVSYLTVGGTAASRVNITSGNAFLSDFIRVNSTSGSLGTVEKFRVNAPTTGDNLANAIFSASAATSKALVVQGVASQAANLQEWQNSSGIVLNRINASGAMQLGFNIALQGENSGGGTFKDLVKIGSGNNIYVGDTATGTTIVQALNSVQILNASGNGIEVNGSTLRPAGAVGYLGGASNFWQGLWVESSSNSATAATIKARATQSADVLQITNSTSNVLSGFDSNGQLFLGRASGLTGTTKYYNASGAGSVTLQANNPGASNYTLNLPAENGTLCSTGSVCAGYAASSGSVNYIQNGTGLQTTANFNIQSAAAGSIGGIIRGAASQTANLQEWQDSTGAALSAIDASGNLAVGGANAATTGAIRLPNLGFVKSRNAANTADQTLLYLDSSNQTHIDSGTGTFLYAGGSLTLSVMSTYTRTTKPLIVNYTSTSLGANEKFRVTDVTTVDALANVQIGASATTAKPLIVQGVASQTANLQEWQSSTGSALAFVKSSGAIRVGTDINLSDGTTPLFSGQGGSGFVGIALRGFNSTKTNLLFETQGNAGGQIFGIYGAGNTVINLQDSTAVGLIVKGAASQTANLQEWQSSTGTVQANIGSEGQLGINAANVASQATIINVTNGGTALFRVVKTPASSSANVLIVSDAAGSLGLAVRANASQSANIQEWQDSTGAALAKITSVGDITVNHTGNNFLTIQSSNSGSANVQFGAAGTGPKLTYDPVNGALAFYQVGAEKMRFTSGGVLEINSTGTAGTVEKFRVNTPTTVDNAANAIFSAGAASNIALVVQGTASQTGDLQSWQDSTGAALLAVQSNGRLNFGSSTQAVVLATSTLYFRSSGSTIKIQDAHTGNVEIANGGGKVGIGVTGGSVVGELHVKSASASTIGTIVQGTASQSANLQEWQDSTGVVLSSISSGGNLTIGSNAAAAGAVRLANGASISWRNAANTADKTIKLSSSNVTDGLDLPGNVIVGGSDATAGALYFFNGGVVAKRTAASGLQLLTTTTNGIILNSSGQVGIAPSSTTFAGGTVEKLRVNDPTTVDNLANVVIGTSATTSKGLVIQGLASQAANLQEWQTSGGTVVNRVASTGAMQLGFNIALQGEVSTGGAFTDLIKRGASNNVVVGSTTSADTVISAQNQILFSTGNGSIANFNTVYFRPSTTRGANLGSASNIWADSYLGSSAAGTVGLHVVGSASQTANLQQWEDNSNNALLSVTAAGAIQGATSGGAVVVNGGTAAAAGTGGAITLTSGAGGATSGNSGTLSILTGNTTSGTAGNISIDVGTSTSGNGSISIGTAARAQTITIGNTTGATDVNVNLGSGVFNVTNTGADATTVAQFNNAGATACTVQPGGTGFACSSDARLKTNVATVIDPLDTVKQLRGVTFNWNSNPTGQTQTGFIAQELEQLIPGAVSTDSNGYKVANYTAIIPYLVGAAQVQDLQITGLQQGQTSLQQTQTANDGALANRITSLEQKVAALEASQPQGNNNSFASLNVSGMATIQDLKVVGSATIGQLTVTGNAHIAGNLKIDGHVLGSHDSRGEVTIPAGQTEATYTFTSPYATKPFIVASPVDKPALYSITATPTGFTVKLSGPDTADTTFNFMVQE